MQDIKTILSSRETGLPDESVDVALSYDVFQMISDKDKLLEELHRVLKSDGILFATAEHLDPKEFTKFTILTNHQTLGKFDQKASLSPPYLLIQDVCADEKGISSQV